MFECVSACVCVCSFPAKVFFRGAKISWGCWRAASISNQIPFSNNLFCSFIHIFAAQIFAFYDSSSNNNSNNNKNNNNNNFNNNNDSVDKKAKERGNNDRERQHLTFCCCCLWLSCSLPSRSRTFFHPLALTISVSLPLPLSVCDIRLSDKKHENAIFSFCLFDIVGIAVVFFFLARCIPCKSAK